MTALTKAPEPIRRIVVTLESCERERTALDIAVRAAAALGAELEGVFVEDINLIRLSGLPFLREVRAWSLIEQGLSTQTMERELRTLARQAEHMFLEAARAMGVAASFRVWRGRATVETFEASFGADILTVRGGPRSFHRCLSARQFRLSVTRPPPSPVNVLYSASPAGDRALGAACSLARSQGAGVHVLLAVQATSASDPQARAEKIVAQAGLAARFTHLGEGDVAGVARAVRATGTDSVLVAPATHPLFEHGGVSRCLEALPCPVLFVR